MAVALLLSSGVDRGGSKAVADKAKTDLLAQTAVNAAIAQLVDTLNQYPDSATTWETINGNDGTVLYYHDKTPDQAITSATAAQLFVLPLASGATAQLVVNKTSALPALTERDVPGVPANAFNLNRPRTATDTIGLIGSSPQWLATTPTAPQAFRGKWINTTNSDTKVTGRYAFWMEDESFKANANLMGNTARGSATLGNSPSQVPFQGILKSVLTGSPDYDSIAGSIVAYRSQFPGSLFFNFRDMNQVNGQAALAENAKFETTLYSGSANLSRSGAKRVNLNQIVSTSTDPVEIRKQLDEIIKTITTEVPNFAQRFYRLGVNKNSMDVVSTGTPSDQTIYLNKIAANIRDYITSDSQPTIVNNDPAGSIRIGSPPKTALGSSGGGTAGPNEVMAIGKKRVPFLQEYAQRIRLTKFSPPAYVPTDPANPQASNPGADYEFYLDYYFEFWNMTSKDINPSDLGPKPFLLVSNQFGWDAGGGARTTQPYLSSTIDIPSDPNRDFKIPLFSITGLVFKAGTATVITTDPNNLATLVPNSSNVFVANNLTAVSPPPAHTTDDFRRYAGKTFRDSTTKVVGYPSKARALRINMIPRDTSVTDYETEVVLGNDIGILETFEALPVASNISVNNDTGDRIDSKSYFLRGGSLRGNTGAPPGSLSGDPRTNNEQLSVAVYNSSLGNDQTRYVDSGLNNNAVPGNSSLTMLDSAPPGSYVNFTSWADPFPNPASPYTGDANHAPAVMANAPITSIAELGNVFDPARTVDTSGSSDIQYSRGGDGP